MLSRHNDKNIDVSSVWKYGLEGQNMRQVHDARESNPELNYYFAMKSDSDVCFIILSLLPLSLARLLACY